MRKQFFIILSILLIGFQAHSIVELRAGYGVNTPSDDSLTNAATLSTMSGFNLDAIVELPMLPFGFGLRYESMGLDVESGAASYSTDMTRTSLLVNYRIIDLFAYFGLIGTVGFQNEVVMNGVAVTTPTPATVDLTYDADLTYSVGVEAGVSLGLWMIGGELGYNMATYENSNNIPNEVPFDGVYAKVLVGVGL